MTWLIANWKLVAIGVIVAALGIQTYRLRDLQADYAEFVLKVEAAGREAKAKAEAVNAHNDLVREELEHDIREEKSKREAERRERADRFGALYGKYMGLLNHSGSGGVPEAHPGAGESLPSRVCFDRARFADGLRQELGTLYREAEQIARRGEDGIDAGIHWGRWARLAGACPKP